jgi:3'-phosphoadenosine 5'-phosphosulfate (PAPS) 3'-phosphatase
VVALAAMVAMVAMVEGMGFAELGKYASKAKVLAPLLAKLARHALEWQSKAATDPEQFTYRKASDGSEVTPFDCVIQYQIVSAISSAFPEDGILGEE